MSKTTGNKVSIDKNSSFARFALCWENNISQWTDRVFSTSMGNLKTLTPGLRTPTTDRVRGLPTDQSTDYPY